MKILYVALKESVPGSHGGAVHILEVTRGLEARGHRVTVVAQQGSGAAGQRGSGDADTLTLRGIRVPSNFLLMGSYARVAEIAREVKPDVVMERYYNFAGAGIWFAHRNGLASVLEVNAPMVDPPGTAKARVDALMLGLLSRWAQTQARWAMRIVTPLAATVPAKIAREKIREIPWGANVDWFDPGRVEPKRRLEIRERLGIGERKVVVFLGSFRPWHGVREFCRAARRILQTRQDVAFLMIGAGELLEETRAWVQANGLGQNVFLTGAVRYEDVRDYLACADVGVAPFNTSVHPPLRVGFYWSPLKIHEYMAMGLPTVTIDVHPLNAMIRAEREGLLYREGDEDALAAAIVRLLGDGDWRRKIGENARRRVVENYSWAKHCEKLEQILEEARWAAKS
jgi:glycosyltransferase involved in cell wall biosynthesis